MKAGSISTTTVKVGKAGTNGCTPATATCSTSLMRALLNPSTSLEPGATYIATVTSGARDIAGNALDQDLDLAGNQPKSWRFKVSP